MHPMLLLTAATLLVPVTRAAAQDTTSTTLVIAAHAIDPAQDQPLGPTAVLIRDGKITAVGEPDAIRGQAPPDAEIIDLGDRWLMPGFIDAHTHVLLQGDITQAEYDEQILKESIPYRTIRATVAARIALEHGFTPIRDVGDAVSQQPIANSQ